MNAASGGSRASLARWATSSTLSRSSAPSSSLALSLPRTFATEAAIQPSSFSSSSSSSDSTSNWKVEGRRRPLPQTLAIDANHPLYGFFRRIDPTEEELQNNADARARHVPFEPYWAPSFESGRSWTAPELRRKSFKDLHTLWYILARERNLLATQRQAVARYGMRDRTRFSYPALDLKCRTTMARIKQVLNERRIAYLEAAQIIHPPAAAEVELEAVPTGVEESSSPTTSGI